MEKETMIKLMKSWRYWALCLIFGIAVILLTADVKADYWFTVFILSKSAGAVLACAGVRLFSYWMKNGKINELKEFIDK